MRRFFAWLWSEDGLLNEVGLPFGLVPLGLILFMLGHMAIVEVLERTGR